MLSRFVVGSRMHSAFMLDLPILSEQIRGFSKKWPIKRQRGENYVIGGIYLESNRVFWAIIHANRLTGVACSLRKESKNTEKKSHKLYISLPCGDAPGYQIETKLCRVGALRNVITHKKIEVDRLRALNLAVCRSYAI